MAKTSLIVRAQKQTSQSLFLNFAMSRKPLKEQRL